MKKEKVKTVKTIKWNSNFNNSNNNKNVGLKTINAVVKYFL